MRSHPSTHRGFVFIDVALGLALLGIVAVALVTVVGRRQRAAQKLSDTRAATRVAEDALTSLRSGQPPAKRADAELRLKRLADTAPQGYAWVRATTHIGTSDATVIGVVPATAASALEGGKP